jgi:hypothetical protein
MSAIGSELASVLNLSPSTLPMTVGRASFEPEEATAALGAVGYPGFAYLRTRQCLLTRSRSRGVRFSGTPTHSSRVPRTSLSRRIRCRAVLRSGAANGRHRHPGEQGHGSDHAREASRPDKRNSTSDTASTSTSSRSPMYPTITKGASPRLSMGHSRNCSSAFSNATIWVWPRSSATSGLQAALCNEGHRRGPP